MGNGRSVQPPTAESRVKVSLMVEMPAGNSCSPADLLKAVGSRMNKGDRQVVALFPEIYYYHERDIPPGPSNKGWDTKEGHYISEVDEHLAFRFRVLAPIASGSFGQLLRCRDYKSGQEVAVKMRRHNTVAGEENRRDRKVYKALKMGGIHPNFASLTTTFFFRGHTCSVYELAPMDLCKIMHLTRGTGLPLEQVRSYTRSILHGLSYIKRCGIIHGDLKPANIQVVDDAAGEARLADFGVADEKCLAFGTPNYNSPELRLGQQMTTATDIWALGCVAAEMAIGSFLFEPHSRPLLQQFIEVLGLPPQSVIDRSNGRIIINAEENAVVDGVNVEANSSPLAQRLQHLGSDGFLNFVQQCLWWEPTQRFNAQEALNHPWVQEDGATPPSQTTPPTPYPTAPTSPQTTPTLSQPLPTPAHMLPIPARQHEEVKKVEKEHGPVVMTLAPERQEKQQDKGRVPILGMKQGMGPIPAPVQRHEHGVGVTTTPGQMASTPAKLPPTTARKHEEVNKVEKERFRVVLPLVPDWKEEQIDNRRGPVPCTKPDPPSPAPSGDLSCILHWLGRLVWFSCCCGLGPIVEPVKHRE